VVGEFLIKIHHRGTEDTEVAQRRAFVTLGKDRLLAELAVGFAKLGQLEKSLEITKNLSSES